MIEYEELVPAGEVSGTAGVGVGLIIATCGSKNDETTARPR